MLQLQCERITSSVTLITLWQQVAFSSSVSKVNVSSVWPRYHSSWLIYLECLPERSLVLTTQSPGHGSPHDLSVSRSRRIFSRRVISSREVSELSSVARNITGEPQIISSKINNADNICENYTNIFKWLTGLLRFKQISTIHQSAEDRMEEGFS